MGSSLPRVLFEIFDYYCNMQYGFLALFCDIKSMYYMMKGRVTKRFIVLYSMKTKNGSSSGRIPSTIACHSVIRWLIWTLHQFFLFITYELKRKM